jgi:hypothetical protein
MKKLRFIAEFEVDFEAERSRIERLFGGDTKKRQLELIDLFEQQKFSEFLKVLGSLPEDEEEECSEREFTSKVFTGIIHTLMLSDFKVISTEIVEAENEPDADMGIMEHDDRGDN